MSEILPPITPKGFCCMCEEKIKWECDYEGCNCVSPKELCENCEEKIFKGVLKNE